MATITTLAFNIRSSYDGSGTRSAVTGLLTVSGAANNTNVSLAKTTSLMGALTTVAVGVAPALIPIGVAALGVGAATGAMAVTAGSALGIFGLAVSGAVKQTMALGATSAQLRTQLDAARSTLDGMTPGTAAYGTQLATVNRLQAQYNHSLNEASPMQRTFLSNLDRLKASYKSFITATSPITLSVANDVISGLADGIGRLKPVVDAAAPGMKKMSQAMQDWLRGSGLKSFIDEVIVRGVPALNSLLDAGRNMLAVLGLGFREFAGTGVDLAAALDKGAKALRKWAEDGGFARFMHTVQEVGPAVGQFFKDLGKAAGNILSAINGLGPASLLFGDGLLKIVAALPLPVMYAMLAAWAAYRVFMIANTVWGAIFSTHLAILNGNTIAYTVSQWSLNASFLACPLFWLIAGIVLVVAAIVLIATKTTWFQTAWEYTWNFIKTVSSAVWNWLKSAFNTVVDFLHGKWGWLIAFLGPVGWLIAIAMHWQQIWNGIKAVFNSIVTWIRNTWNSVTTWFHNTTTAFGRKINSIWRDLWNSVSHGTFGAITNWLKNTWHNVTEWFHNTTVNIGKKIKAAWKGIWDSVKNTAKTVWHGIGGVIEGAINGVSGMINTLIGGFNKITSFLHIKVKVDPLPKAHLNFAHGGTVPGYSPGRDTVPAMLSPGEGVLTPEAVRGLGGPGFVHSANRTYAGHRGAGQGHRPLARGYATGGMVPVQNFYVGGIVQAALAHAGVGLGQVTQGEYSTGVAASAGTHSGGGVVDIAADPGNQAGIVSRLRQNGFAAWFRTPSEGFSYHIHAVLMNDPDLSPQARDQVTSFLHGGNGLANGGPDTGAGGGIGGGIMDLIKKSVGKILANVYKGAGALAGIGGGVLDFFGMGASDDDKKKKKKGLFGTGFGPDIGPDVVGAVGDVAQAALGGGTLGGMLGQMVLSMLDAGNIAEGLGDPFKGGLGKDFGGIGDMALGFGKKILKNVLPDFLLSKVKDSTFDPSIFGGGSGGGAGVAQWSGLASVAMQMGGLNPNQLSKFLDLMAAESGGNPRSINNYDSNALAGIPSKGLMQVIDPTFRAYHVSGTSNDIYDPLANMAAAANYIRHTYGGNVPGSPYAAGTNNATRGWHLVGEHGPELRYFRGGERVLNAQKTAEAVNGGRGGGAYFAEGAFQIDARGATVEAVREMETNLLPKLRMAVQAGVGKKG